MSEQPWHSMTIEELQAHLATGPHGLSPAVAEARLEKYGPNQLEEAPPRSAAAIFLHQFKSPLIYILLAACAVTLALGELIDAGVIAAVLALNASIGFAQERRAEVSVRALMRLVAPRARVLRDGREVEIPSQRLVPGDLIVLESGMRVPADVRLRSATALAIDESLLTGESETVHKRAEPLPPETLLPDRHNMAFTGTTVASGRARAHVVATGFTTELGKIAGGIREAGAPVTPLRERMDKLARLIGIAVGVGSVAVFVIGVALGESISQMFLVAVALAVAAIPEGLPVVLTITLAVGIHRMARRQAIIRKLEAIETLGSTTVIGSDKTGTLTENRMTVQEVWAGGRVFSISPEVPVDELPALAVDGAALAEHHPLYLTLLTGALTNEAEVYHTDGKLESRGDPTEVALLLAAERLGLVHEDARARFRLDAEVPFEPDRRYSATVRERGGERFLFVKGAPERVLAMCDSMLADAGPAPIDREQVLSAAAELAARGLRLLGMAWAPTGRSGSVEELLEPQRLTFVGLVGMMDPPRPGVREAIAGCQEAGVRVVMITGDHAATAQAIGRELGIAAEGAEVLTGLDLGTMDEAALRRKVREVSLFARVDPEQKLRVVKALKSHGEVVAVTGDGVNDAPALRAADIGIAMGQSGTDVAREAADMVLADDNFISIYAALDEGRTTFDNVRKATFFLISTGAASLLTIPVALALGWPVPFLPAQLLWLNLVTNGLQDVALAFEPRERDVLKRPPRRRGEGIVSPLLWERTAIAGVVIAAGTLYAFRWALDHTGELAAARTIALTTMVLFQMFQVGNARSEQESVFVRSPVSNPFLLIASAGALLVHVGALYFGPTQAVLRVWPILDLETWVRIVAVAFTIIVAMELHKLLRRGRGSRTPATRRARPLQPHAP